LNSSLLFGGIVDGEEGVWQIGGGGAVESEVAELTVTLKCAGDAVGGVGHSIAVAGETVDVTEAREIGLEVDAWVGDWDLVVVVVWGEGEVSDEVLVSVGGSVVLAAHGHGSGELVGIEWAGRVVKIAVGIKGLSPEDEDLNGGIGGSDIVEGCECTVGQPEGVGDGDEVGVEASTVSDSAGGVDWGVSGISGNEGTASALQALSWPVDVFGGNKGGEGGGDLHI